MNAREKIPAEEKIEIGLVHGRFQPPHNGHVRYILAALARAKRVLIGICTPEVCTDAEAARTGYPCAPRLNPFTYEERAGMITAALAAAGIARRRYSFLPFPSDYKNIEKILPKGTVFLMSVTSESDAKKIRYLASRGFAAETVFSVPEGERLETSGGVRYRARRRDPAWESLVPESIAAYMKDRGLTERLAMLSGDNAVE